jgi:hypothetical protein
MNEITEQLSKKRPLPLQLQATTSSPHPLIAEVLTSLGAVEIVGTISSFFSESSSIFSFLEALVFSRVPHQ